jgi:hypothetical protein
LIATQLRGSCTPCRRRMGPLVSSWRFTILH